METPFEIDFNPGSFNTLIEQSGKDSLITINNEITMQCVRRKIAEREV